MIPGTPVTIELVGIIFAVVFVVVGFFWWALRLVLGEIRGLRKDVDDKFDRTSEEIKALRHDIDKELDSHMSRIDAVRRDMAEIRVHVSENYMSKTGATVAFDRFSAELKVFREDVSGRLARMETYIMNGGQK